jgi:hypothetical protein
MNSKHNFMVLEGFIGWQHYACRYGRVELHTERKKKGPFNIQYWILFFQRELLTTPRNHSVKYFRISRHAY